MKARRHIFDIGLDDTRAPAPGDLVHRHSPVKNIESWWRITDARPVESKLWGNRWALTIERLLAPPTSTDRFVWESWAYAKGERPGERT